MRFLCISRFNANQNFTFKVTWFASLLKQIKHSMYCITLPQILDDFLAYKLLEFDFLEDCTCEVMLPRFITGLWRSCFVLGLLIKKIETFGIYELCSIRVTSTAPMNWYVGISLIIFQIGITTHLHNNTK